jgi:hypothetical protein
MQPLGFKEASILFIEDDGEDRTLIEKRFGNPVGSS